MGMDLPPTQDDPTLSGFPLRIERGARVLGPDGQLGTLRQMIVSQDTGDLRRLVVRSEAGMDIELPASSIIRASGDEIRLTIGLRDLAEHPELARPFAAERYEHGGGDSGVEAAFDTPSASTLLTEGQVAAMSGSAPAPGNGLLSVVPLAAIGILVGGSIGGLAYLLTRRRQRVEIAVVAPAGGLSGAMDGMRRTWDQVRQGATASRLRDASQAATATTSDLLARASTLSAALAASAGALWRNRPNITLPTMPTMPAMPTLPTISLPTLRRPAAPDTAAITERVRKPVRQARKAVARQRRGARRFARRVRWLRNGLILGAVIGILYAPEPGQESRRRIGRAVRDIPGVRALLGPDPQNHTTPRENAGVGASGDSSGSTGWRPGAGSSAQPLDLPPTVH